MERYKVRIMKQKLELLNTKIEPIDRNLFLCKGVDQSSIEDITRGIIKINEEDDDFQKLYDYHKLPYERTPIKIYLDTYGGFVYQTFGLVSIMEKSKTPIHTIVTGCAMSAGFVILISGHRRFAYSKSTPLYHQASYGARGTVKDMEQEYIESKRIQTMMENIVLEKTKITKQKLQKIYDEKIDWYMSAKEALKLKVVDEII